MKWVGEIKARLARLALNALYVPYESHATSSYVRDGMYRNKAEARRDALHMAIYKHPLGRRLLVWLIIAAGPPVKAASASSLPRPAKRS